jgi:AcrR family transcriptional regulator
MAPSARVRVAARGRPPSVTSARLQQAILEIEGEVPTIPALARQLGVSVATVYSHVRGHEELARLAADVVFDAWELPAAPPASHWAGWMLEYARDARRMIERYPVVHSSRPMAGGQLRHIDRVLSRLAALGMTGGEAVYAFHQVALLILGLGAQIEAIREEEARAGVELSGLLRDALSSHPGELPALTRLERQGLPPLDTAFDELVWFTLTGIARRRGEVLATAPPSSW